MLGVYYLPIQDRKDPDARQTGVDGTRRRRATVGHQDSPKEKSRYRQKEDQDQSAKEKVIFAEERLVGSPRGARAQGVSGLILCPSQNSGRERDRIHSLV